MLSSFYFGAKYTLTTVGFFADHRSSSIAFLPQVCVHRYFGKRFSCIDHFLVTAFAQFTHRESLRDIESCLRAQNNKLYHMGIRSKISQSTLADANELRNWSIHADLAQTLIKIASPLYVEEDLGIELDNIIMHSTHQRSIFAYIFSP